MGTFVKVLMTATGFSFKIRALINFHTKENSQLFSGPGDFFLICRVSKLTLSKHNYCLYGERKIILQTQKFISTKNQITPLFFVSN